MFSLFEVTVGDHLLERSQIQFDMQSVDISTLADEGPWSVTVSITNRHRAVVGGRIYAHIGLTQIVSEVITILPGHTSSVEFKHHLGPFTRIHSNEIVCGHGVQHGFSFLIINPENHKTYATSVD